MPDPLLQLEDVSLRYGTTTALDSVSLEIGTGEFVCLRGPSGCGKTSMLLLAGGMLRPTAGIVQLAGRDLYALDTKSRGEVRASEIGFVFQTFHLVPYLDIVDNVRLAGGGRLQKTRDEATGLLERMGLGPRATHKPMALSVGERQRAALARALFPARPSFSPMNPPATSTPPTRKR